MKLETEVEGKVRSIVRRFPALLGVDWTNTQFAVDEHQGLRTTFKNMDIRISPHSVPSASDCQLHLSAFDLETHETEGIILTTDAFPVYYNGLCRLLCDGRQLLTDSEIFELVNTVAAFLPQPN